MCTDTKKIHYKEKLSDVRNQTQFYIATKLLHHGNMTTLPTYDRASLLANDFAHYLNNKIQIICTTLQGQRPQDVPTL